jgi:hypothetical protein
MAGLDVSELDPRITLCYQNFQLPTQNGAKVRTHCPPVEYNLVVAAILNT